ncbi:MAG: HAD family phosphatase, partial [Myxococcales bacterium]|nr:HAD family phosphatase [Myxococcales bacterium]
MRSGQSEQNIVAVLWDLDGTLVQTEGLHAEVDREVLGSYGFDVGHEELLAYTGMTSRDQLAGTLGARGAGHLLEEAYAKKLALMAERIVSRALPTRGIEGVLRDVPMRTHRFALVTSTEREIALALLERFGWSFRFEVVVGAEDVPRTKPAPDPYLRACELLGVAPAQALVVEDAPAGIRAGKAAGCRVAALCTTFGPAELGGADFVL